MDDVIKRLILFLFVIIFVNLYLISFFLDINIFDESRKPLTSWFGSYFSDPLYAIVVLGTILIIVVAFVLIKIGNDKSY